MSTPGRNSCSPSTRAGASALATYQEARRTLAELGLEPGPTLRELEQAILNQAPELVTAPLRPVGARRRSRRRRAVAAAVALAAGAIVAGATLILRNDPPSAGVVRATPHVRANSLVEINPFTDKVASVTHVGRGPESIAATGDAMWVANTADRTVARVSLATKDVRILGGAPVAEHIVAGLNGDVWLSSFEEPVVTMIAERGRIASGPHVLAAGPRRVHVPGSAEGLAIGGGYLWVTSPSDSGGHDTVSRIDLRSRRLVSSIRVGTLPLYVTFGYGSVWVSNYRDDSVSIIRPGSKRAETITTMEGPLGIAAGAGAVWVVSFWTREVLRIDPETRRVLRRIRVGEGPLAVAAGAGAVWVTNRDSKTISRIDPVTNRVVDTLRLAAAPHGIQFAHGRLWVTTQSCGSPTTACPS